MKKIIEKYSEKPEGLFKRLFITFLFGYMPIALLHIVLNIAGIVPVNFNDEGIYGLKAIFIILIYSPFMVILLTIVTFIYYMAGNLILRMIKKIFL